jgi:hypothetical protein
MDQYIVGEGSKLASHGHWNRMQRIAEVRCRARDQIATQPRHRQTQQLIFDAEESRSIDTGLNDSKIGFVEQKNGAVRLNRPGEMDLLSFTIREVRVPE